MFDDENEFEADGMFSEGEDNSTVFSGGLADDDDITTLRALIVRRGHAVSTADSQGELNTARTNLRRALDQAELRIAQGPAGAAQNDYDGLRTSYRRGLYTYTSTVNTMFWSGEGTTVASTTPSSPRTTGSGVPSGKAAAIRAAAAGGRRTVQTAGMAPGGLSLGSVNWPLWLGVAGLGVGAFLWYRERNK